MRLVLVGAYHPAERPSEMRRLDVELRGPLGALLPWRESVVRGRVDAEGLLSRAEAEGVVLRRRAGTEVRLAGIGTDGAAWSLVVRGGRGLRRGLSELSGELLAAPGESRTALLRVDLRTLWASWIRQ